MSEEQMCYYSKIRCYDCQHNKECEMRKQYLNETNELIRALPSWD